MDENLINLDQNLLAMAEKTRYSDEELQEFKELILEKLDKAKKDYDLLTGVVYAFSTALGFGLALVLFAGLREQMSLVKIPKGMQGTPIALITAGLLAMAFMGFSGVV